MATEMEPDDLNDKESRLAMIKRQHSRTDSVTSVSSVGSATGSRIATSIASSDAYIVTPEMKQAERLHWLQVRTNWQSVLIQ